MILSLVLSRVKFNRMISERTSTIQLLPSPEIPREREYLGGWAICEFYFNWQETCEHRFMLRHVLQCLKILIKYK